MEKRKALVLTIVATVVAVGGPPRPSFADQPPLRIGFLATLSGPFTLAGKADQAAIAAFLKEHNDTVAGRKVDVITRDDGGANPEGARRLAQEMIVQDHVDFLVGITFSPNGIAVGDVSTAAKKPLFLNNAPARGILERNPYVARFSYTESQLTYPLAHWAIRHQLKRVFTLVLDYSPGIDAAESFRSALTADGGSVVDEVRVPLDSKDYSAYIQRIKDAHPDAVFVFLTVAGQPFLKAWTSAGGPQSGIKILATGDLTNESTLPALGESAVGVITAMNYSASHDSAPNRALTRAVRDVDPSITTPDFSAVATYDAMTAIFRIVSAQNGGTDPDKAMELVKGMTLPSARGPIEIDRQTRNVIQNIYIRRVENVNGAYQNTEIATYPNVKDAPRP